MSRIRVNIDRLVLNGFEPLEGKALANALERQLKQMFADPGTRNEWARSHRTPVMRLGRMPLESGTVGAERLGGQIARSVRIELKA